MSNFVDIEVDPKTVKLVTKGLKDYGIEGAKAIMDGMKQTAFAIDLDAKRSLKNNNHIVTGRLWSSVHVEFKGGNTFESGKTAKEKIRVLI